MQIARGRTRGYFTVDNAVIDGLLELGPAGIDAAGFYCALKRFVDRRTEERCEQGGQQVMDWSVEAFCRKFHVGRDRFYRLMDVLWRVGLVDIEKRVDPKGWQNRYLVHDYPAYGGPVRVCREGTFRHRRQGAAVPEEGIPETGIPETGIPETGIPDPGIPAAGIPETGSTKNTTKRKTQLAEKDNDDSMGSFSSSSSEEEEKERASRAQAWEKLPSGTSPSPAENSSLAGGEPDPGGPGCPGSDSDVAPAEGVFPSQRLSPGAGADQRGEKPKPDRPPTNRDLIAELVERLHKIPGVERSRGHYSLVGKALKEYGFDVVRSALEDVEAEYKGAELLGEPYPTEKELRALLFRKCRWNAKPGPGPERQEKAGEEKPLRWLSFEELERLGCVLERDPEWGHVTFIRVPNEEVKERVRRARMQG